MAELSVIVLNWNGKHLLPDCLMSLSKQSLTDLEILLVDNGSSDGSVDYVRSYFPAVRIITLEQNLGFSAGNNRGIQASSGKFVALFNNDAVADCYWAERLLAAASVSEVGIAASKVLLFADRSRLDSAGDSMTTVGVAYKRGHLAPADQYQQREYVFGASGCAMLLRRTMLDDVGLLDEDFFFSYEDGDLCFRAQLRGWKCIYVPDAVVYHKLNASIGQLSRERVYYGQRNAESLYFKNMPGWLLWKYLPLHLLNVLLAGFYFSSLGYFVPFLQSKRDFVRCFVDTWAKRREIQARRRVTTRQLDSWLDRAWLRPRLAGKVVVPRRPDASYSLRG